MEERTGATKLSSPSRTQVPRVELAGTPPLPLLGEQHQDLGRAQGERDVLWCVLSLEAAEGRTGADCRVWVQDGAASLSPSPPSSR